MIISPFRLQILIAFTIESGKSPAYLILLVRIFLLEQILYFCETIVGKCFKVCPPGKSHEGVCAQHSLHPFPFPASRNTLHTDRAHQSILGVSTLLNAQVLSRVNAQQIKTRKLLLVGMWRSSVEDSS